MNSKEVYQTYLQGNELRLRGKELEALQKYRLAIQLMPSFEEPQQAIHEILVSYEKKRLTLVDIYMQEGKMEKAVLELENLLTINPNTWKARKYLAQIYLKQNQLEKAIVELKKAIEISPKLLGLHLTLGKIYDSIEQYQLALDEYEKVLQINPQDSVAEKQKSLTKKILNYSLEHPLFQASADKLLYISGLFLEKEMPEKAVFFLKKAFQLVPGNREVVHALANACQKQKNFEEAVKFYKAAAEMNSVSTNVNLETNLLKL